MGRWKPCYVIDDLFSANNGPFKLLQKPFTFGSPLYLITERMDMIEGVDMIWGIQKGPGRVLWEIITTWIDFDIENSI